MASTAGLTKKLLIKAGHRVLVLNAPTPAEKLIKPLPEGAELLTTTRGTVDCVVLFAQDSKALGKHAAKAIKAVKPDGLLWIAYPKKTSKLHVDLHRDAGWDAVTDEGYEGVSLIAIDDDWSCMRFRR